MIGQRLEEDNNMEVEQYRSFKKKKKIVTQSMKLNLH